jgi:hypothetical protein
VLFSRAVPQVETEASGCAIRRAVGVEVCKSGAASRPLIETLCPALMGGHDHSDPDQPPIRESATRDPAGIDVVLVGAVGVPAGRVPVSGPLVKVDSALLVDDVDALLAVDVDNAVQFFACKPLVLDRCPHLSRIVDPWSRPLISSALDAMALRAGEPSLRPGAPASGQRDPTRVVAFPTVRPRGLKSVPVREPGVGGPS